jgi:hypothetical protein
VKRNGLKNIGHLTVTSDPDQIIPKSIAQNDIRMIYLLVDPHLRGKPVGQFDLTRKNSRAIHHLTLARMDQSTINLDDGARNKRKSLLAH